MDIRGTILLTTLLYMWNMHLLQICLINKQKRKYRNRRWWVRPCNRRRYMEGSYIIVFLKYKHTDHEKFFNLTRMTVNIFDDLLEIVSPYLQKASYREFLTPEFRLAFTICYLASGNNLPSMANYWQIGKSTACLRRCTRNLSCYF